MNKLVDSLGWSNIYKDQMNIYDIYFEELPFPLVEDIQPLEVVAVVIDGQDNDLEGILQVVPVEKMKEETLSKIASSNLLISLLPRKLHDYYVKADYAIASRYHPLIYSEFQTGYSIPRSSLENYKLPKAYDKGLWLLGKVPRPKKVFEPSGYPFGFGYACFKEKISYTASIFDKRDLDARVTKDFMLRNGVPKIPVTGDILKEGWLEKVIPLCSGADLIFLDLSVRTAGYRSKEAIRQNFKKGESSQLMETMHDLPYGRVILICAYLRVYSALINSLPDGSSFIIKVYDPIVNRVLLFMKYFATMFARVELCRYPYANPLGREYYIILEGKGGCDHNFRMLSIVHFVSYHFYLLVCRLKSILTDGKLAQKYFGSERPLLSRNYLLMIK